MPGSIIRSTQLDGRRVARLVLARMRDPRRLQVACLTQACDPQSDGPRTCRPECPNRRASLAVPEPRRLRSGLLPRLTTGTARAARRSGPPHLDHSYVRRLQCFDPPDEAVPRTVPPAPNVLPPDSRRGRFFRLACPRSAGVIVSIADMRDCVE
jgi:hypothetical protein